LKTWDEILAAARAAGFLRFSAAGIAILERPKRPGCIAENDAILSIPDDPLASSGEPLAA
jgi:hypothetical protein